MVLQTEQGQVGEIQNDQSTGAAFRSSNAEYAPGLAALARVLAARREHPPDRHRQTMSAHADAVGLQAHSIPCTNLADDSTTTIADLAAGKLVVLGAPRRTTPRSAPCCERSLPPQSAPPAAPRMYFLTINMSNSIQCDCCMAVCTTRRRYGCAIT